MFKENIKLFFGYSWKSVIVKIVFGLILFVLVTYIYEVTTQALDYWTTGWPFHFYESWGPFMGGGHRSNNLALVADIVLWYLIFCLATFVVQKIKRNKK